MEINNLEKMLNEIRTIENPVDKKERIKKDITKCKIGDVISIKDECFKIMERNKYQESSWQWFEYKLYSLKDGRTLFLEWEIDDEVELTLYYATPTLKETGLTPEMLKKFDDDEEGSFLWNSKTMIYEESDKALFFRGENTKGEAFYYWDFEDDSESMFFSVEKWDDGYEVFIGKEIEASTINILAQKA